MFKYRSELDGVRAIAVLGVLFFHFQWIRGGWLGVDVFFVLSGFLIPANLLRDLHETGRISIRSFYLHRVRRIAPALLTLLIGSFFLSWPLRQTKFFQPYIHSFISTLFSASNMYFWQYASYFSPDTQYASLLHTWSLGVEEQFYLIIPAFFFGLARLGDRGRQRLWWGLAAASLFSFIFCRYGRGMISSDSLFYLLPFRMWELALGTFTALWLFHHPQSGQMQKIKNLLATACLVFLIYGFVHYNASFAFAEKAMFIDLATAIIILTANDQMLTGRLLSSAPFRFLGRISYSFYLWHWPLIVLWYCLAVKYSQPFTVSIPVGIALALVTLGISFLSWKFIEQPFRRKNNWKSCLCGLAPYMAMAVICLMVGEFGWDTTSDVQFVRENRYSEMSFEDVLNNAYPVLGPAGSPQFMLIGDSHAWMISGVIGELAQEFNKSGLLGTHSAVCPLFDVHKEGAPQPYAENWLLYIQRCHIKHVILVAHWEIYHGDLAASGSTNANIIKNFRKTIQLLIARGHEVWVMEDVPSLPYDAQLAVYLAGEGYAARVDESQTHFVRYALAGITSSQLHIIDPWPKLVQQGRLSLVHDGQALYFDKDHLTIQGARQIKDIFRPIFNLITS